MKLANETDAEYRHALALEEYNKALEAYSEAWQAFDAARSAYRSATSDVAEVEARFLRLRAALGEAESVVDTAEEALLEAGANQ